MKPCFVVMHSYHDMAQPYPVGVWFDQIKAQEYCDEQHRLQDLCRVFLEKRNELPTIPFPVFPKPEPKKDKTLLKKLQELEKTDSKGKEFHSARVEWLKYIEAFNKSYKDWEMERAVFIESHTKERDLALRNQFKSLLDKSFFMTEELEIKLLDLYDRGWRYWDESSNFKVEETVCHV